MAPSREGRPAQSATEAPIGARSIRTPATMSWARPPPAPISPRRSPCRERSGPRRSRYEREVRPGPAFGDGSPRPRTVGDHGGAGGAPRGRRTRRARTQAAAVVAIAADRRRRRPARRATPPRAASTGSRPSRDRDATPRRTRRTAGAAAPGATLELGVELAGHEPRVVLELDDLDEPAVGRLAGQEHAGRLERLAVAVVHLEAVAMPLVDDLLAVDRGGLRAGRELGRVEARGASSRPCPPCRAGRA